MLPVILSIEQMHQLAEDGMEFIHRVTNDKKASPAEIAALPEIMKVLCAMAPNG